MTIYAALPFVRRTGMYSVRLPNLYNVSFDYYYCLIAIMLSYIPCKKIYLMCTCTKRFSDKCRVFFASVSSALLPHAAAEKKGASRGGHRGEGWINRLPPSASIWAGPASTPPSPPTLDHRHHHHRSLSRTRGALPSEWKHWKHVHRSSAAGAGDGSWWSWVIYSSLHLFMSEEQLFISPELTPAEKIVSF